jgi:uncharacterized surface protein with fasciclin (FAS1) repeats
MPEGVSGTDDHAHGMRVVAQSPRRSSVGAVLAGGAPRHAEGDHHMRKEITVALRKAFSAVAAAAAVTLAGGGAAQAQNCMEGLGRLPEASAFVGALGRTGVGGLLRGSRPFTVRAPTNQAVEKVPINLRNDVFGSQPDDGVNPVTAPAVVNAHIVDGKIASADLQGRSSASFQTRNGNELRLVRGQDGRFVLMPQGRGRRAVEGHVVRADIPCSNGVVHLVDTVLIR